MGVVDLNQNYNLADPLNRRIYDDKLDDAVQRYEASQEVYNSSGRQPYVPGTRESTNVEDRRGHAPYNPGPFDPAEARRLRQEYSRTVDLPPNDPERQRITEDFLSYMERRPAGNGLFEMPNENLPQDYQASYGQYFAPPQTLGGSPEPRSSVPVPTPRQVGGAILEGILGPYHGFVRAWEDMSAGREPSTSDVLQAAVPMAIPAARLPRNIAYTETHPSITGGGSMDDPFRTLNNSRDLLIESPSIRGAEEIIENARIQHGPIDAANMTPDEFLAAARARAGITEDEWKYHGALVRQREQQQQARANPVIEGPVPTGPRTRLPGEMSFDEYDRAMSRLNNEMLNNHQMPYVVGVAANQTDMQIVNRTLVQAGIDAKDIRVRTGKPDKDTGQVSTYIVFPGANRPVKIRVSNHPGHTSRHEIDAQSMTPDELSAAIRRELDPETASKMPPRGAADDSTKGSVRTVGSQARDPYVRANLPDDVLPPNRLGSRDDRLTMPRIHETIVAGARSGMNNFEIRQAIKANLGEEVTEGQINTYIGRILKDLKEGRRPRTDG